MKCYSWALSVTMNCTVQIKKLRKGLRKGVPFFACVYSPQASWKIIFLFSKMCTFIDV